MEKHLCYYCGEEANYQLKNGNWCCKENVRSCEAIKKKISEKAKEKWNQLKEKGIKKREDIPENLKQKNNGLGQEGICYYCGQEAKYQLKNGKWCCREKHQQCPYIKEKNSKINKNRIKKQIESGNFEHNLGEYIGKGHASWNKGKTKENDERIKKISNSIKEGYKSGKFVPYMKGKHHSDETKRLLSKCGGYKKGCGRGKKGWYKGYWCDSSWELAFVIYNLENGIKFERNRQGFEYEYNGKIHKYYPDFILEDGSYVEIKGYKSKLDEIKINSFSNCFKLYVYDYDKMFNILTYVKKKYGKNFVELYENYK